MAGMLPFESMSVLDSANPYISVEATAKGLTPHPYVESSNDPVRRTHTRPNYRDFYVHVRM
jgi:hypothetical protein